MKSVCTMIERRIAASQTLLALIHEGRRMTYPKLGALVNLSRQP